MIALHRSGLVSFIPMHICHIVEQNVWHNNFMWCYSMQRVPFGHTGPRGTHRALSAHIGTHGAEQLHHLHSICMRGASTFRTDGGIACKWGPTGTEDARDTGPLHSMHAWTGASHPGPGCIRRWDHSTHDGGITGCTWMQEFALFCFCTAATMRGVFPSSCRCGAFVVI